MDLIKGDEKVNFLNSHTFLSKNMNTPLDQDTFFTLGRASSGIFKEKGSKFLSHAFPVENEDQIKSELLRLRKVYFDASHHCYAWVLGPKGLQFRTNDDGEPNHTAGDPILGQIRSHRLTNVLIVVVRYFGGTKLGVSGLIQSYKNSASIAIEEGDIVEKKIMHTLKLQFPYEQLNDVMKIIKSENLEILDQELNLDCRFTLEIRQGILKRINEVFLGLYGLKIIKD